MKPTKLALNMIFVGVAFVAMMLLFRLGCNIALNRPILPSFDIPDIEIKIPQTKAQIEAQAKVDNLEKAARQKKIRADSITREKRRKEIQERERADSIKKAKKQIQIQAQKEVEAKDIDILKEFTILLFNNQANQDEYLKSIKVEISDKIVIVKEDRKGHLDIKSEVYSFKVGSIKIGMGSKTNYVTYIQLQCVKFNNCINGKFIDYQGETDSFSSKEHFLTYTEHSQASIIINEINTALERLKIIKTNNVSFTYPPF